MGSAARPGPGIATLNDATASHLMSRSPKTGSLVFHGRRQVERTRQVVRVRFQPQTDADERRFKLPQKIAKTAHDLSSPRRGSRLGVSVTSTQDERRECRESAKDSRPNHGPHTSGAHLESTTKVRRKRAPVAGLESSANPQPGKAVALRSARFPACGFWRLSSRQMVALFKMRHTTSAHTPSCLVGHD